MFDEVRKSVKRDLIYISYSYLRYAQVSKESKETYYRGKRDLRRSQEEKLRYAQVCPVSTTINLLLFLQKQNLVLIGLQQIGLL